MTVEGAHAPSEAVPAPVDHVTADLDEAVAVRVEPSPFQPMSSWPEVQPFSQVIRREATSGQVAVVTGASRGLGAGMAVHFASAGVHLGLCARRRPNLVAMTRPRAHNGRVEPPEPPLVATVDVTDYDALAAFADAVIARFGRIDLWVNNAGVLEPVGPLAGADPYLVARHIDVNVTGVLYGTMVFAGHVRRRPGDGVLVNISSGAATHPYLGWAPYGAAKAAINQLTEVVAREERGNGLRAHSVAPGIVDTDMQAYIRQTDAAQFPEVDHFRQLKRDEAFNSPTWVAEKLLELAFGQLGPVPVLLRVPDEPRR
jgi:benzil reductase ((S)-benzoin forming)